jgi:hypothetical protein
MNAEARYRRAEQLGDVPTEDAARELIAMLADDGEVMIDEGCSVYDVEPTYAHVASAARDSLAKITRVVWPVLVEALPTATPSIAYTLLGLFRHVTPEERVALPAAVLDRLAEHDRAWAWERDFARRVHARELATPAAFWRARLAHPTSDERERALRTLVDIAHDKAALAREVAGWLDTDAPVPRMALFGALHRLPLPPALVRELAASRHARAHVELAWLLAHHGEPAASLVPVLADMLDFDEPARWMPASELENRRWKLAVEALAKLGPLAAAARPVLVDRLLARSETASLLGSLRSRLLDALGDPEALLAEIEPRLRQLEASTNVVEKNRAAEIRRWIAGRIER